MLAATCNDCGFQRGRSGLTIQKKKVGCTPNQVGRRRRYRRHSWPRNPKRCWKMFRFLESFNCFCIVFSLHVCHRRNKTSGAESYSSALPSPMIRRYENASNHRVLPSVSSTESRAWSHLLLKELLREPNCLFVELHEALQTSHRRSTSGLLCRSHISNCRPRTFDPSRYP